jgi:hypothetical protein
MLDFNILSEKTKPFLFKFDDLLSVFDKSILKTFDYFVSLFFLFFLADLTPRFKIKGYDSG